jgi:hypothetical protein
VDLDNLKAAVNQTGVEEAFMCAVAPGSFGWGLNYHYPSDEAYLHAIAEAMHEEYQAITERPGPLSHLLGQLAWATHHQYSLTGHR